MIIFIISIIILTSITNAFADILMTAGKPSDKKEYIEKYFEIAKTVSEKDLLASAIIGGISISAWMLVVYFLYYIKGNLGFWLMFFYAMFVGFNMLTHVLTANTFLLVKSGKFDENLLKKNLIIFSVLCIIFAGLYSVLLAYLGFTGVLKINILQYLTLPICSIVLIQFTLPKIFKNRFFEVVAGTFGQFISMISTISIIVINFKLI